MDLAEMAAKRSRFGSSFDEDVSRLQVQDLPLTTGNGTILCSVSTAPTIPSCRYPPPQALLLPANLSHPRSGATDKLPLLSRRAAIPRRKLFSSLHNLSHPGSGATDKLVSDRFVWPGMHKGLDAWTRACLGCQRIKVQRHKKAPIGTFATPDAWLSHVNLDIILPCLCPMPVPITSPEWVDSLRGRKLSLYPTSLLQRWSTSFVSSWVAIFGTPCTIATSPAAQSEFHLFQSLLSFLGCTDIRNTAYHSAANKVVERVYRKLKFSLRATEGSVNWSDHFPPVLLDIRSSLQSELDCSATELAYGATTRLSGWMISPNSTVLLRTLSASCTVSENLIGHFLQFCPGNSSPNLALRKTWRHAITSVCLCRPLKPIYDGLCGVITHGTETFRMES
nr:unnamed protein product [Spirometra erinaceieuropaei]